MWQLSILLHKTELINCCESTAHSGPYFLYSMIGPLAANRKQASDDTELLDMKCSRCRRHIIYQSRVHTSRSALDLPDGQRMNQHDPLCPETQSWTGRCQLVIICCMLGAVPPCSPTAGFCVANIFSQSILGFITSFYVSFRIITIKSECFKMSKMFSNVFHPESSRKNCHSQLTSISL